MVEKTQTESRANLLTFCLQLIRIKDEKSATDRRLARTIWLKDNRLVDQTGAVIFLFIIASDGISQSESCQYKTDNSNKTINSQHWQHPLSYKFPQRYVDFYINRGSQVYTSFRSLLNECHWHSATLWKRANRLPLW